MAVKMAAISPNTSRAMSIARTTSAKCGADAKHRPGLKGSLRVWIHLALVVTSWQVTIDCKRQPSGFDSQLHDFGYNIVAEGQNDVGVGQESYNGNDFDVFFQAYRQIKLVVG
ncbi:hypothetical protein GY45DRAFT_1375937 [Cubamyces sp. BRFM 1775]|nr:hypothetical protein GY45DRAFT_1375937 [Cubamyces sp. BRFM 1775]